MGLSGFLSHCNGQWIDLASCSALVVSSVCVRVLSDQVSEKGVSFPALVCRSAAGRRGRHGGVRYHKTSYAGDRPNY